MPWPEASAAGEQRRFIAAWLRGEETVAALCRRFGISRKPGYTRINRFKAWGYAGLGDRSRAPHTHPLATSTEVARQLLAVKRAHPTWGPKKVVAWLRTARPAGCWPAPSTAGAICKRAGLVQPRQRQRRSAAWSAPFTAASEANVVWGRDFKGWFRTTDGTRIDPLTVQDAAARYLLAGRGLTHPRRPQARRSPAWGWGPDAAGGVVDQAGQHPRADRAGAPRAERPPGAPAPHAQGRDDSTTQAQSPEPAAGL